jgi:hypothetical protein
MKKEINSLSIETQNLVYALNKNIKLLKQLNKANELLRRVYNIIELSHLNDNKCIAFYLKNFNLNAKEIPFL